MRCPGWGGKVRFGAITAGTSMGSSAPCCRDMQGTGNGVNEQGERNVPHSTSPPHRPGDREPSAGTLPAPLLRHCPGARMQAGIRDKATGMRGQETSRGTEELLPPWNPAPRRIGVRRTLPQLQGDGHRRAEQHQARRMHWEEPGEGRKALLSAGARKTS